WWATWPGSPRRRARRWGTRARSCPGPRAPPRPRRRPWRPPASRWARPPARRPSSLASCSETAAPTPVRSGPVPDSGAGPPPCPGVTAADAAGSMVRVSTPAARTDQRPLYTAGGLAAAWAAGIGLAVLLTFTLIGWVAAPHDAFGQEIADVARTAVQAWLVGHLVGFGIPGGEVMMLPLGLVVLPGLLLYRAGRWLARTGDLPRLRHTFRAALALAGPYAAISGTLALIAQTEVIRPSVPQALVAGFVLAFLAGGLGVLRQQLIDKRIPLRRLLELMPDRSRSLLAGTAGATGVLLLS